MKDTVKFTTISVSELSTPKDKHLVLAEYWWATNEEGEALIYTPNKKTYSPQCNLIKSVAERLGKPHGGTAVFVKFAYLPPQYWEGFFA